jgi:hypothetical protein
VGILLENLLGISWKAYGKLWETIFLMVVRHQLQDFEGGIFLGAVFSLTLKNGLGGLAWIA